MSITADRLLQGLKRRGIIPASQALLSNADLLAMADDIISSRIVPLMISLREDYFVVTSEEPLVSGQRLYDIPYRAIGRTLRDLKIRDTVTNLRKDVRLMDIEDEHVFMTSGSPHSFYFKGDQIAAVPEPNLNNALNWEMWWECPPSRLVETSGACQVVSVSDPNVVVNLIPSTITNGSVIDFIQGHSANRIYSMDQTIASATGVTLTFASSIIPDDLVAGDWISLAQTSPVLNLPDSIYSLLEGLICQRILKNIGDFEGAKALDDDIRIEIDEQKKLLSPRIIGENKKIVNRGGLLRGQRSRFKYGWLIR